MTCPTPATGARTSHYYVEEIDCGVTPSNPVWNLLRYTSGNLQLTKDSIQSQELDGSIEVADILLGSNQAAGEISIELSYGSYDDLIEAALGGTWAAGASEAGLDVTVDDVAKTFTRLAGDFTTNVSVGDVIKFDGFSNAANNAPLLVTSVSALVVTAANASDLVAENANPAGYTISDKLSVGTERRTFSILTHFADADGGLGEYHITTGVEITGYTFDVSVNAIVTGTLSTIGLAYQPDVALPAGSTFAPLDKTEPYAGVDGRIVTDGVRTALVTSLTNTLDNNASAQFEVGSNNVSFVEQGRANSTLSISTFFEDSTLLNRFINETESSLVLIMKSVAGNTLSFSYPRIAYTTGTPDVAGEGSITQTLDAQALAGSDGTSSVIVQRLPA